MTEPPQRTQAPGPQPPALSARSARTLALVLTAALAQGLTAGIFAPNTPLAALIWSFLCAVALASIALGERPGTALRRMLAPRRRRTLTVGLFGLAWASGAPLIGTALAAPENDGLGLALVVGAGALAFLAGGRLHAALLVLPAMLCVLGLEALRHGAGPNLLAFAGIGIFSLAATAAAARTISR